MQGLTENQIQSQILNWLEAHKIFHWRQNTGAVRKRYEDKNGQQKDYFIRFGFPGISDILGCHRGRLFAVEVKRPGNKATADQQNFLRNVVKSGGVGMVCRSLDEFVSDWRMAYGE